MPRSLRIPGIDPTGLPAEDLHAGGCSPFRRSARKNLIWSEHRKTVVFITHSIDEAIVLGDRIMVMTASPGRAKSIIDVSLERPRNVLELRNDPRYGKIVYGIWGYLKDEVERARL